ncbi:phosphoethanolamine transferase [Massilia sp. TN1-12]|uniref:phosphoethanolamine transferase n=1 Tax=Massilia paldalensis TaxID=3377675 RepID=UPI00384BE8F0
MSIDRIRGALPHALRHALQSRMPLALRQAAVRAFFTAAGLATFWQLGMQDAHNFTKAAGFVLIANLGLGGLALLLPRPRLLAGAALLLNGLVLATAAIEGFLFWLYGLNPKHIAVADAILGSNPEEAREFVATYGIHMLLVAAVPAGLVALMAWCERRWARAGGPAAVPSRRMRGAGLALAALFGALHFNPTMAKENPLVFWPRYVDDYLDQRAFMEQVRLKVERDLDKAREDQASYAGPAEQTVVLVLGESVNRSNWSLYGYPRRTTPELERLRATMRDQLLVFKNVDSADAATAQSLLKMLTPATRDDPEAWHDQPNVLALARTAGYRVFWVSNQERADGPIQFLAAHAHEQVFVNEGRGREARSLDERMLPHIERILARPEPRKLVVVHMQGAHLRYDLRYPQAYDRFTRTEDGVDAALRGAGRPFWIVKARDQYDNAMLYGDHVIASIIARARRAASHPTSLLYVSDHGQEVGHNRDFAGHSSLDASGYQVPLLVWTNRADKLAHMDQAAVEARSYRTDVLDHTLYGLLDIQARGYRPQDDLLSGQFALRGTDVGARPMVQAAVLHR